MSLYKKYIDFTSPNSINFKLRQQRLRLFLEVVKGLPRPIKVLDVGGSAFYWKHLFFTMPEVNPADFEITITNISASELKTELADGRFKFEVADARHMPQYADQSFDVVHSNSVIEHVGDLGDMKAMGKEVRRIGKRYFVQTPNYWFPIEPHFRTAFFHWMPKSWRMALILRRRIGHLHRAGSRAEAEKTIDSARLLNRNRVLQCFPGAQLFDERFFGLTKSFVAHSRPAMNTQEHRR